MPHKVSVLTAYTPHYQEECFEAWYLAGRPDKASSILEVISKDKYGRKPKGQLILKWRDELGWDVRADELDAKANQIVEDSLINQRVIMLKEQAARANELQKKAMEYLRENSFDSSSAAVQGVIRGAELERIARGLGEGIVRLLQMKDTQLSDEVQKLLERASIPADVVDVEETSEGE